MVPKHAVIKSTRPRRSANSKAIASSTPASVSMTTRLLRVRVDICRSGSMAGRPGRRASRRGRAGGRAGAAGRQAGRAARKRAALRLHRIWSQTQAALAVPGSCFEAGSAAVEARARRRRGVCRAAVLSFWAGELRVGGGGGSGASSDRAARQFHRTLRRGVSN